MTSEIRGHFEVVRAEHHLPMIANVCEERGSFSEHRNSQENDMNKAKSDDFSKQAMYATNGSREVLFYKCPVGGFVSLRPGACPKCRQPLIACAEPDDKQCVTATYRWAAGSDELFVHRQSAV